MDNQQVAGKKYFLEADAYVVLSEGNIFQRLSKTMGRAKCLGHWLRWPLRAPLAIWPTVKAFFRPGRGCSS